MEEVVPGCQDVLKGTLVVKNLPLDFDSVLKSQDWECDNISSIECSSFHDVKEEMGSKYKLIFPCWFMRPINRKYIFPSFLRDEV